MLDERIDFKEQNCMWNKIDSLIEAEHCHTVSVHNCQPWDAINTHK